MTEYVEMYTLRKKRPETRVSYADFTKLIWNMSKKDTMHLYDFRKKYDLLLKTLYYKKDFIDLKFI